MLRLAVRACTGLEANERVWLSPGLCDLACELARRQPGLDVVTADTNGGVGLALARFDELRPGVVLPEATRVVGLGERFERSTLSAVDWAQRAAVASLELASQEGTLALCEGGVVVTGLSDGLSALDLQRRLTIPLLAGPGLAGLPPLSD